MRAGFFILLAVLCACGPNKHQQLVHSGQQAEKNQQWVQAALAYANACRMDPAKIAVCKRAQEMRDYSVEIRSYRALDLCQAGQLQRCLDEIEPVRAFRTTKFAKIAEVLAAAGIVANTQCSLRGAETLSGGLAQLSCLQHWRKPLWEDPNYQNGFIAHSKGVSTSLSQQAMALPNQAGARVSYLQAAACIAPISSEANLLLSSSTEEFSSRSATQLRIQLKMEGRAAASGGVCQRAASELGRGIHCGGTAPHTINMSVAVLNQLPRWNRSVSSSTRTKRYLAGTEQVENPEFDRARAENERAEDRVRDAKEDARDREKRCNDTESSSDCNAHESALRTLDQREDELNRARSRFGSEPRTITKDVYKDHIYTVRTHHWRASFRASIQLGQSAPNQELTEVTYTDTEHSGFGPANISEDRLTPPTDRYFVQQSNRWLQSRIGTRIRSEMSERAMQVIQNCGPNNSADCWTTAQYWQGETSFGLSLAKNISQSSELTCTANVLTP